MEVIPVYFRQKKIFFAANNDIFELLEEDFCLVSQGEDITQMMIDFHAFEQRQEAEVLVYLVEDVLGAFSNFKNQFHPVEAAGGLIENEKEEYLFIFRHGKWDLPKGKIEKTELPDAAAVRECEEECGVNHLTLGEKLPLTYHVYFEKEKWKFKTTHWYKMSTHANQPLLAQEEENITAVEWMGKDNLTEVLDNTYHTIKDVLIHAGILQRTGY